MATVVVDLKGNILSVINDGSGMSREEAQMRYSKWWAERLVDFIAKEKKKEVVSV